MVSICPSLARGPDFGWNAATGPALLSDAESVLALGGVTGPSAVQALVARGRILAARDEPEALSVLDQAARAAEGVGDVSMLVPVADARSEYFLWAGDADRAQQEARQGLRPCRLGWRACLCGRQARLAAVESGRHG